MSTTSHEHFMGVVKRMHLLLDNSVSSSVQAIFSIQKFVSCFTNTTTNPNFIQLLKKKSCSFHKIYSLHFYQYHQYSDIKFLTGSMLRKKLVDTISPSIATSSFTFDQFFSVDGIDLNKSASSRYVSPNMWH